MKNPQDQKAVDNIRNAPNEAVNQAYKCVTKGCGLVKPSEMPPVPYEFQRDMTGRIHGETPDRIPENMTTDELEHARDELRESIKNRLQNAEDAGGPNAGHMEQIRKEQQLLRQVEDKLGGK